jgi:hypothetical protein
MSHSKSPPSLPQIVDEAGDSPRWLPLLGAFVFALLAFMVFFAAWSDSRHSAGDPAAMARDESG